MLTVNGGEELAVNVASRPTFFSPRLSSKKEALICLTRAAAPHSDMLRYLIKRMAWLFLEHYHNCKTVGLAEIAGKTKKQGVCVPTAKIEAHVEDVADDVGRDDGRH